jgi:hypothetical protein
MKIIGISPGRSGSKSLSEILRGNGFNFFHEKLTMAWDFNSEDYDRFVRDMEKIDGSIIAPQVNYVDKYLESFPDTKVIYLKRPLNECVKSWQGWLKKWNYNHFQDIEPNCRWDFMYPSYGVEDLKEALKLYLKDYDKLVSSLLDKHPDNITIIKTKDLSNEDIINNLLDWLKVEIKNTEPEHLNKGENG